MNDVEMIITSRPRDLGGFSVRRILPYATHRMVGPFIFFDHMGPADLSPGEAMDVRPHPHVNLATVTYLFSGRIGHRDSLGTDRVIEPGAINWMVAGRGIVHSERTPEPERTLGSRMHGIQLWVALPDLNEEDAPSFAHHARETLPEVNRDGATLRVLLGEALGQKSPVQVHSPLVYLEARLDAGASINIPGRDFEHAVYVVDGEIEVNQSRLEGQTMAVLRPGRDLHLTAGRAAHVMIIGGRPVGPRQIHWNFVSSSAERIEEAKTQWRAGPRADTRFPPIPGDAHEFIPLPSGSPPGTIM